MLRRLRALLQRNEEPVQDETLALCRTLDAAVEATSSRFASLLPCAPKYAKWAAHSDQPPELPAWLVSTVDELERVQDAALEPALRAHPHLAHEVAKLLKRVEHEYLHATQDTPLLTQLRHVSLALLANRDERARLSDDLMALVRAALVATSSGASCEQLERFEKLALQHVRAEGACIATLIRAPFLVCATVNKPDVPWAALSEAMLNVTPNALRRRVAQLRALLDETDIDRLFNEMADAQVSDALAATATLSEARRQQVDGRDVVLREQAIELVRRQNRHLVVQCEQLRPWFRKAQLGHMLEVEWVARTPAALLAGPHGAQQRLQDTMPSHLQLARTELARVRQRLSPQEQTQLEQQLFVCSISCVLSSVNCSARANITINVCSW